eukprot:m.822939 g.822939  ORF g.822939 m.822939 type:complete len:704 (+) comp59401_c1_seq30:1126-3237(+)
MPHFKKATESTVLKKAKANLLHDRLWAELFQNHGRACREFFEAIRSFSTVLLLSTDDSCRQLAGKILEQAFKIFDSYCRQEIIGDLVTHVATCSGNETETALAILRDLTDSFPSLMLQYSVLLKGMLEFSDGLSLVQISELFCILSSLAMHESTYTLERLMDDDMHIILRKQLTHGSPRFKKIGVVGAITVLRTIARTIAKDRNRWKPQETPAFLGAVCELLELISTSSEGSAPVSCLFFDELSALLKDHPWHEKILQWISDTLCDRFQDVFVADRKEIPCSPSQELLIVPDFGIISEEAEVVISFLPTLLGDAGRTDGVLRMCPLFRLLQVTERELKEKSLEDIDALLGCEIYSVPRELLAKTLSLREDSRDVIYHHLFFLINWFRECINAFADQSKPDYQTKVLVRLHHLCLLEQELAALLVQAPDFRPALAHFEADEQETVKSSKPAKARKAAASSAQIAPSDKAEEEASKPEKQDSRLQFDPLGKFSSNLREIDTHVFDLLQYPINVKDDQPRKAQLSPRAAALLLTDLKAKLKQIFNVSKSSRFNTSARGDEFKFTNLLRCSREQLLEWGADRLPHLCNLLETILEYLQAFQSNDDDDLNASIHATVVYCFETVSSRPHIVSNVSRACCHTLDGPSVCKAQLHSALQAVQPLWFWSRLYCALREECAVRASRPASKRTWTSPPFIFLVSRKSFPQPTA